MANNYTDILALANKNNMGLSNTIKRDYGIPLDYSSVQESYEAALAYAKDSTLAYIGQPISVGDTLYIVTDEANGYLKAVGTKPSGDDKSIVVAEDGTVSIYGFTAAANATLPRKNSNGTIEWVTVEAIVSGDGNEKTRVVAADDSDITVTPSYDSKTDTYTYILDVAFPAIPEYSVIKETAEDKITYKITKDGTPVGDAIVVPNNQGLNDKVAALEAIKHVDDVVYDSTNQKIYLVSKGVQLGEGFDASAFIKDGLIESVTRVDNKLIITWNSDVDANNDSEKDVTEIDLADLITVYESGTGINITGKIVSIDDTVVATVSALNEIKATAEAAQTAEQVATALEPYAKTAEVEETYATKVALNTTNAIAADAQSRVDIVEGKIKDIISVGGEPNVLEKIIVNGVTQPVEDRGVNLSIPVQISDLSDGPALQELTTKSKDDIVTLNNSVNSLTTTMSEKFEALEDKDSTIDGQISSLQSTVETHTTNIATLTAKDLELSEAIQENTEKFLNYATTGQLTTATSNIETAYKAADQELAAKIGDSFTSTDTVAKAIEEAKTAGTTAQEQITELVDGTVKTNTTNISTNTAAIEQLRTDLNTETTTRESIEGALGVRLEKVESFFVKKDGESIDPNLDTLVEMQTKIKSIVNVDVNYALNQAKAHTNNAIKALDSVTTGEGTIVKDVSQTDGVVTVTLGTLEAEDLPNLSASQIHVDQPDDTQLALDTKLLNIENNITTAHNAATAAQKDVDDLEKTVAIVEQVLENANNAANNAWNTADANASDIADIKSNYVRFDADSLFAGEDVIIFNCGSATDNIDIPV